MTTAMKKSLVIVVDRHDSALGTSAHNRARVDSRVLVLAAMDYPSPTSFLSRLAAQPLDLVMFTWRFVAWELMILKKQSKRLNSLPGLPLIAVLIPDHLGTSCPTITKEEELLEAIDYFLVTNLKLAESYSTSYPSKFRGVLHDLPSDDLIQSLTADDLDYRDRKGIIWIGNSKWGRNLGVVDHKGYHKVVMPMKSALSHVAFTHFDSARKITPHKMVLRQLSESRYLIQTSKDEGTGLPLLEAMGMGTIPITTNVGVAEEVIPEDLNFLIVERDPKDFISCYLKLEQMDLTLLSRKLRSAYKQFVERATRESIEFQAERASRTIRASTASKLVVKTKWLLRYLKHGSGKERRHESVFQ